MCSLQKSLSPRRASQGDGRDSRYLRGKGCGFRTGQGKRLCGLGPGHVGALLPRSLPHVSSNRCRRSPSLPARHPLGAERKPATPAARPGEGDSGGESRSSGAGAGVRASPARGDGASSGGGKVKERGLSLYNAGPGPFWCNRIITEGRASLSKHTSPPARPLPGINIKDWCIVFCKRAIQSPSGTSPCPRLWKGVFLGSAHRYTWSLLRTESFLLTALIVGCSPAPSARLGIAGATLGDGCMCVCVSPHACAPRSTPKGPLGARKAPVGSGLQQSQVGGSAVLSGPSLILSLGWGGETPASRFFRGCCDNLCKSRPRVV